MNSLLILPCVVVWRVCTILRVIAPVSAVRAWCEYQLEGMAILRDVYSSLAKAAGRISTIHGSVDGTMAGLNV